jgi:hypothetical protein
MHMGGRLTPEQFWARFDARENEIRAEVELLPCHGLANWPGWLMLGDWSRRDGELISAGLVHGHGELTDDNTPRVHVVVGSEAPQDVVGQRLFNAALSRDPGEKDVVEAMRHADAAPTGTVSISVDGRPEAFDHWVHEQTWFAARHHDGHTLAVEARHVSPDELNIVRVHDIEPYLAGRRASLRRMRGED